MTAWISDWLRAFGLTLLFETPVALPLLSRWQPQSWGWGRGAAAVAFANLATHPLVWFLFPGLTLGYATRVAVSEGFAVGVETAAYALVFPALGPRRAVAVSLLANATSWGIGLVLRATHVLA